MNRTSIPAFIENFAADTANAKYSRAKLKMYYVGETGDHRLFTKDFSDKLLTTIAYTPVVGFYSVAEDDFVGHNNVQNIYGIVPADATVEYVEDAAQGVTFAVTDIILYTGRPDEIGVIASKIVGKQHSLELDPKTVQYKINTDSAGNFKNIEFTEGELIGLSVLGDAEKPAFSGSEFFSAIELPEFITDDNKNKYEMLFSAMSNVEPTAEEVVTEIYKALDANNIYGYLCEHKAEQYAVIETGYRTFSRYLLSRNENNELVLSLDCSVRPRYLSDAEIETLAKGTAFEFNGTQKQKEDDGAQAAAGVNTTASTGSEPISINNEELEALRSNYESLESQHAELTASFEALQISANETTEQLNALVNTFRAQIIEPYKNLLSEEQVNTCFDTTTTVDELVQALSEAFAAQQTNTDPTVFEISNINNHATPYDEYDVVAVVEKYKNMNRGKN